MAEGEAAADAGPSASPPGPRAAELRALAALFLRLGATAFGGPAAHTAYFEREVVQQRRWLTPEQFTGLLGAVQLIPGPNSTELAMHVGHARAGAAGLVVAGACFVAPAMLLVLAIAWVYVACGHLPAVASLLRGAGPVIVAVVAHAAWRLGRPLARQPRQLAIAIASIGAVWLGVDELLVLALAGLLAVPPDPGAWRRRPAWLLLPAVPALAVAAPCTLGALFLFFLRTGAVIYGSGYVLIAFLRADLVDRWHWLSEQQLLDAIAVGQITPGPLFTTATFVGYVLGGLPGGLLATLGIFLPAFVFVAVSAPLLPRLRQWRAARRFLDGVAAASLGLLVVAAVLLGRGAIDGFGTGAVAVGALLVLLATRCNATWLVLAGALLGLLGAVG